MKMKKITSLLLVLFSLATMGQTSNVDLMNLIEQLQNDKNHVLLSTLAPTQEECIEIMITPEAGAQLFEYAQNKFSTIKEVPDNTLKASGHGGRIALIKATKDQLLEGITGDLPADYTSMGAFLADGQVIYGVSFVNADREVEKVRSCFLKTKDRWVFIPLAYRFDE